MMPGTGGSRVTVLQMMSRAMAALGVVVALCTLAAAAVALNREQVTALPTVPSGNGVTIRLQDHQLDPTANVFFATALEPTASDRSRPDRSACSHSWPSESERRRAISAESQSGSTRIGGTRIGCSRIRLR